MVAIAKGRKATNGNGEVIREIEKLTAFVGIGGPLEEDEAVDADADATPPMAGEEWATDRPGDVEEEYRNGRRWDANKRGNRGFTASAGMSSMGLESRFAAQKLVISDDDIEDSD